MRTSSFRTKTVYRWQTTSRTPLSMRTCVTPQAIITVSHALTFICWMKVETAQWPSSSLCKILARSRIRRTSFGCHGRSSISQECLSPKRLRVLPLWWIAMYELSSSDTSRGSSRSISNMVSLTLLRTNASLSWQQGLSRQTTFASLPSRRK